MSSKTRTPREIILQNIACRCDDRIGLNFDGSWCIPGDTEHGAAALEDSVAVKVFSPVREDYLPRGTT